MNRGRENVTETECAVACAAVNIAGELRYARKAAPAIWPRRLHPSPFSPKLLLALSNSPLRTLTHTCSKYETVCASCVCEPICVSVCVLVEYNNENCPVGIHSHIPVRPSSSALSPLLLFLRAHVFFFAVPFLCAMFSQHR